MSTKVAIVYNEPASCNYPFTGEEKAELGVLDEVDAVYKALTELEYNASLVPLSPPLDQAENKLRALETDLVFNLFEGFEGSPETEAFIADALSEIGFPYTGCPASALALALDKAKAKALFQDYGIATPCWQVVSPENIYLFNLNYPCIVKPCGEDASHGLSSESVVDDSTSMEKQVRKISRFFGGKALVEEFIDGREFNVTVMGNKEPAILSISEIAYCMPAGKPNILTFTSKWEPQSIDYENTKVVCPADIDAKLQKQITNIAVSAFRLIGCCGYARLDLRLDTERRPEVIEINPNPDISPESGAARQALAAGMTYNQFIEKIVMLAIERI